MLTAVAVFLLSIAFLFVMLLAMKDFGSSGFYGQLIMAILLCLAMVSAIFSLSGIIMMATQDTACPAREER